VVHYPHDDRALNICLKNIFTSLTEVKEPKADIFPLERHHVTTNGDMEPANNFLVVDKGVIFI
jgi:hypothetical protein